MFCGQPFGTQSQPRAVTLNSCRGSVQPLVDKQRSENLRVTIITPTYNQAQYIAQCIESVLQQTHRNIEYLIYDACSTDGTEQVIAPYLEDARITYRREPDNGQANAVNKGFDAATGDIVCWLNSDDFFFDSESLAKVCDIFAAHEKIDVVAGDGYAASADGVLVEQIVISDAARISYKATTITDNFLQPATFWRRNEIRLDEKLHFVLDWKFFLSLYQAGSSFYYLPEFLAVYRLHGASKTTQDSAARKNEVCEILRFSGASGAQRSWAWLIYRLYALSETLHIPAIKKIARFANIAMWRLSIGRIVSC